MSRFGCYLIAVFFFALGFYFAFVTDGITPSIVCWLAALFSFFLGEITDDNGAW